MLENKKIVIYIHGFASSGRSEKAQILKKKLSDDFAVLTPSLPYIPELAIESLEELIKMFKFELNREVYLVGSSLGGFYATYLSKIFNIKAVLINPVVDVSDSEKLNKMARKTTDYFNCEVSQKDLTKLKNYATTSVNQSNFLLLLQSGDDVLFYKEAMLFFSKSKINLEDGGSHRYEGFERKISLISKFMR
jgi:predicted esterase YcpF (UPF0227 family)